jgi:hypothetical protein
MAQEPEDRILEGLFQSSNLPGPSIGKKFLADFGLHFVQLRNQSKRGYSKNLNTLFVEDYYALVVQRPSMPPSQISWFV